MYKLGEHLRLERLKRNLSLEKVANAIEVSSSYLYRLEKGVRRNPSMDVIERLSTFYKIDKIKMFELAEMNLNIKPETTDLTEVNNILFYINDMNVDSSNDVTILLNKIRAFQKNKHKTA